MSNQRGLCVYVMTNNCMEKKHVVVVAIFHVGLSSQSTCRRLDGPSNEAYDGGSWAECQQDWYLMNVPRLGSGTLPLSSSSSEVLQCRVMPSVL